MATDHADNQRKEIPPTTPTGGGLAPGVCPGGAGAAASAEVDPCCDRFRRAYWQAFNDLDSLRLGQWEQSHLTMPQLRVLFQLRRTPGLTTGCLARLLGVTVSTTSGLVGKLAERGLVSRGSSDGDRRQIPLALTEEGQQLAGELAHFSRPFLNAVTQELGDRLEAVITALEELTAASSRVRQAEGE